jgi:hypothetical protein
MSKERLGFELRECVECLSLGNVPRVQAIHSKFHHRGTEYTGDGTMKEPFRINLLSEFFVPVWY